MFLDGVEGIYFYNHYHNGDIHLSRELVKKIRSSIPTVKLYYISNLPEQIFYDLPVENLCFDQYNFLDQDEQIFRVGSKIFINTWIGQNNRFYLDRTNRFAVSAYANLNLFNHILNKLGVNVFSNERQIVPSIDFTKLQKKTEIDLFLEHREGRRKVLFCNNRPMSSQAESFELTQEFLSISERYKNIDFYVTNKNGILVDMENLYFIDDICQPIKENLNQISYISNKCDIIFGRASGPYEMCKTKQNLFDSQKKFICFSKEQIDSSWVNPFYCECEFLWSNIFQTIKYFLDEECQKLNAY
jgi:hypothetical protein